MNGVSNPSNTSQTAYKSEANNFVKMESGATSRVAAVAAFIFFTIFSQSAASDLQYDAPGVAILLRVAPIAILLGILFKKILGSSHDPSRPTSGRRPPSYPHGTYNAPPPPYSPTYTSQFPYNSGGSSGDHYGNRTPSDFSMRDVSVTNSQSGVSYPNLYVNTPTVRPSAPPYGSFGQGTSHRSTPSDSKMSDVSRTNSQSHAGGYPVSGASATYHDKNRR